MDDKTYGIDRKSRVPDIKGTKPKVCPKCPKGYDWFAAPPRARVCMAHRRPAERSKRTTLAVYESAPKLSKRAGKSGALGRALCMELAWELSAQIDKADISKIQGKKAVTMLRKDAYRITARNVADGKQGRCDLERYSA